jgi:transcription antitermination factor NusB
MMQNEVDFTPPVFSRHQAHEVAMTLLYNAILYRSIGEEVDMIALLENYFESPYETIDLFVREVVIKGVKHQHMIADTIQPHLNKWTFHRLNYLTQAIFILAFAHFTYVGEVEKATVINTAVKLAKKFVDPDDYKFINAVLDKVL